MEDIQSLAKKKYNKIPKPEMPVRIMEEIWCHQCKMKKTEVICCDNFFKKNKQGRCNGKYCDSCMQRHYATCIEDLRDLKEWTCFKCTHMCVCASCKRERGDNVPVKKRRKRKNRKYELSSSPISSSSEDTSYVRNPSPTKKQKMKSNAIEVYVPKPSMPVVEEESEKEELTLISQSRKMSQIDVLAETASLIIASALFEQKDSLPSNREELEISNSSSVTSSPRCDKSEHTCQEEEVCPHCKESVSSLKKQVLDLQKELYFLKETLKTYGRNDNYPNVPSSKNQVSETRGVKSLFLNDEEEESADVSPHASPSSFSPSPSVYGYDDPRLSPSSKFEIKREFYEEALQSLCSPSPICDVSYQKFSDLNGKRWSVSSFVAPSIQLANN